MVIDMVIEKDSSIMYVHDDTAFLFADCMSGELIVDGVVAEKIKVPYYNEHTRLVTCLYWKFPSKFVEAFYQPPSKTTPDHWELLEKFNHLDMMKIIPYDHMDESCDEAVTDIDDDEVEELLALKDVDNELDDLIEDHEEIIID